MLNKKKYITVKDFGKVWNDMDDKERKDVKKYAQKFDVWKPDKNDKKELENCIKTQQFKFCKGCKNKDLYCHKTCKLYKHQIQIQNLIKCIIRDQKQLLEDLASIRSKIYNRIKRAKQLIHELYIQTRVTPLQKNKINTVPEQEDLAMLWGKLTWNEQKVLRMYFGLDCGRKYSNEEISKNLGLNLSSVNSIKCKAIYKLYNKTFDENFELCKNAYESSKRSISSMCNYTNTTV